MLLDERAFYLFDFALCKPPLILPGGRILSGTFTLFCPRSFRFKRDNVHKVLSKDQAHSNHLMLVAIIKLENETGLEKNSN